MVKSDKRKRGWPRRLKRHEGDVSSHWLQVGEKRLRQEIVSGEKARGRNWGYRDEEEVRRWTGV